MEKTLLPNKKIPVIMQVIPELGPGGAEQGCLDVAAEIVRSGGRALVVSNGDARRVHELTRAGATHIPLPVHSKNPYVMLRNISALRGLIKEHDVDIVHARSRAPAWSAWRACEGTDARFMTTCHAPYNINGALKRFYNSSITRGERVIAISDFVASYLRSRYKIDKNKIRIIHRGIALDKFHPTAVSAERLIALSREWRLPGEASVVMLPGRLTRWKGHQILIDAMARLDRSDIFCIFIGADQGRTEYRRELEESVRTKGLEGRFRIIDHCTDMPAAYTLATVVVSASTDPEGFGRVPIEAQAMGRPVIATDHGGARETIIKGETGWLVPPNDVRALSDALSEALSLSANQRAILATQAMSHIAKNFTREQMTDKTLNVYAELLEEKFVIFNKKDGFSAAVA